MVPNEFTDILIKVNLDKSDEALKVAEYSIKENALMTAYNRAYYSIFYTVSALALKHDFRTSKHKAMLQWFNKKFIHEMKLFDSELYDIYKEAFKYRQKGDYDDFYIPNLEKANELLTDAKIFIESVRKEI